MSSGFLLDTNVPSELTKQSSDSRVTAWVEAQNQSLLYLSAISVGELRRGFSLLPEGKRRAQLEKWFEDYLVPLFGDRILPITRSVGERWGRLSAQRQLGGAPLNTADGLIAATALEHGLTLVTRNVKDFGDLGATVLNPWDI